MEWTVYHIRQAAQVLGNKEAEDWLCAALLQPLLGFASRCVISPGAIPCFSTNLFLATNAALLKTAKHPFLVVQYLR